VGDVDLRMRDFLDLSCYGCRDGRVSVSETSNTLYSARNEAKELLSPSFLVMVAITEPIDLQFRK
jgi:hypothetical protein